MNLDPKAGPGRDPASDSVRGGATPYGTTARGETIASIGEFALIERIRSVVEGPSGLLRTPGSAPGLVLGIGDDAAVVRPEPGWDLVLTCDSQVCGRHFDPRWMGPRVIGRRAMTVNLSDIAAMGGEPRHALVSLGLPGSMDASAVEDLYRGLLEALEGTDAQIVGGNLTRSGPEWFVDITLVGRVEPDRALTRAGARPGDRILVTGSPGRSAAGLATLMDITGGRGDTSSGQTAPLAGTAQGQPPPDALVHDAGPDPACHREIERFLSQNGWGRSLVRSYCQPQARVAAGRMLARAADRPVTAILDLSDGLIGDLTRICERSGVRARIDATRFPRDTDLEAAAAHFGRPRAAWTLDPSDDYELLLTVRPDSSDRIVEELRVVTGLLVTEIGEIVAPDALPGRPGLVHSPIEVTGLPVGVTPGRGWDHFREDS